MTTLDMFKRLIKIINHKDDIEETVKFLEKICNNVKDK